MKTLHVLILLVIISVQTPGQTTNDSRLKFIFLPSGLNFSPLKANIHEARIGLFKFSESSDMRVDIGNTIDVFGAESIDKSVKITAGIDFMAYGYSRSSEGLRLQIDAIDGIFGGNLSFTKVIDDSKFQGRLRLLHLSGHLVDDHFYNEGSRGIIQITNPRSFTKDFGELVLAHDLENIPWDLRYYGGISYATLIRPTDIKRFSYLGGFEITNTGWAGTLFEQPVNIFLIYQLALEGTPIYSATNSIQLGVKFGHWFGKGPVIYLGYYSGEQMFSQYFDQRVSTFGAGFTVDFF